MSKRHRPSAFEVSFPEEAESYRAASASAGTSRAQSRASDASSVPSKRKNTEDRPGSRAGTRRSPPPVALYQPPQANRGAPQMETEALALPGEELEPRGPNDDEKPIRVLTDFVVFDRRHKNEMVSLDILESADGADREMVVVGRAKAHFDDREDEDEGQEDDSQEGVEDSVFLELSAVFRYHLDYGKWDDPVYLETQWAFYLLDTPAQTYMPFWKYFLARKRIAQMVVSTALKDREYKPERFLAKFTNKVDPFGHTYLEQDLDNAAHEIHEAVFSHPKFNALIQTTLIRVALKDYRASAPKKPRVSTTTATHNQIPANRLIGNPDLSVLKSENQNATHVTPFIASLSLGLVNETLQVVGSPLPQPDKNELERNKAKRYKRVKELLDKARKPKKDVRWDKAHRVRLGYVKKIWIEGETYSVGDVVLFPNKNNPFWDDPGEYGDRLDVSESATIADFFWFGLIHSLDHNAGKAHIQWFEHGNGILLRELADERQLYLTPYCDAKIDFNAIVGSVAVEWNIGVDGLRAVNFQHFICNYMFDQNTGAFYDVNLDELEMTKNLPPPENCPCCIRLDQQQRDTECSVTKDEEGEINGFTYRGQNYHYEDFVRFYSESGPADLGYLVKINVKSGHRSNDLGSVTCRRVGRIGDLKNILPPQMVRDERHLFLTEETVKVHIDKLLGVVFVPTIDSLQDVIKLEDWVSLSPDHFHLKYQFPNLHPTSWNQKRRIKWDDHLVCAPCWQDKLREVRGLKAFFKDYEKRPLNTLDLFGGVGAFSHSLGEGSQVLKVTHAVEIMPSAAKTFRRNSPKTVVYNQCANTMLQYTIKKWKGLDVPQPYQLYDENEPVPLPPKQGEIKVITAGFPCQAHSSLNMFKDVNDVKNNLVLNALSWVDAIRPIYAFFENVNGFLSHRLNATQATIHRVEGGIEMGGVKLMVRALLDMGYQVRFALLQAAHYGTPQRRIRFFCVAAQRGYPLPAIPQPSHDYECTSLEIKLPYALDREPIRPIRVTKGTALHPTVTIDDAIGDLPRFDWKNPTKRDTARYERNERIPTVECKVTKPHCGLPSSAPYHHEPATRFQVEARAGDRSRDLQHYTRCFAPKRIERVIAIPMRAGADYRSLANVDQEWQLINPQSYTARNGFKAGAYGRLDKDGVFATIVTNVDPTAKQSRVLNPYCKRIVTVRELARGQGFPDHFVFESRNNHVVTMHRQIGNAVPYPVGRALGRELRTSLFKKWTDGRQNAITVEDDEDEAAARANGSRRR